MKKAIVYWLCVFIITYVPDLSSSRNASPEMLKFAVSECKMKRTKQLMSICPGFVFCKGELTLLISCDQQLLNQFCLKKSSNKS